MKSKRHPLANCEECEWNIPEAGFADAVGPKNAKLIFIGESPGKKEAKTGVPFTGPTGELLTRVLERNGIKRKDVRLTNAVACHPPYDLGVISTEPPKSVVECCRPRLMAELEGRSTALLMGNTARRAVTGDWKTGIMKARQQPPTFQKNGPDLIATVHPAACLRNPDSFPSFIKDINKLKSVMSDGPDNIYVNFEPPRYTWYDDVENAELVLKKLWRKYDELVIDIECGVEKDRDFTHPNELLSVGFGYADNRAVVLGTQAVNDPKIQRLLGELLSAKRIICHNGKYDLQVLMRLEVLEPESFSLYADTMLASYVLDERPGNHGLKPLSAERLGAPDYEDKIKPYVKGGKSYANIPRKLLYKYNAYDCAFTWSLWKQFKEEMDSKARKLHDRLCEVSTELIYIELEGVEVDESYLDSLEHDYNIHLDEIADSLSKWIENPRSVQQVSTALDELKVVHNTTGADELERIKSTTRNGSNQQIFIERLLEYRKVSKIHGTYIKGTAKRLNQGRIFPTYLVHGTTSGRLAARNPNIHNVPRGSTIKNLFVSAPGNIFIQCDFGQAELRTIAILAKDRYLQEVFKDVTRDIHGEVADVLFGKGKWDKEDRVRAKSYVFGSIYGLSPYSIALDYGITELRAFREQQAFFRMIPQTMKWRKQVLQSVLKNGRFMETPYGRKRRFMLITESNKHKLEKEILAFLPQSTASDVTLNALVQLRRDFGSATNSPKIRITVHDSIVVECEESIKDDVAQHMSKVMIETAANDLGDFVPFKVDTEFGHSWGSLTA